MAKHYAPVTYARAEGDAGDSGLNTRLQYAADHIAGRILKAAGRSTGRFLDVGCGDGRVMAAMQRAGFDVDGIETDAVAAELAYGRTGVKPFIGDLHAYDTNANVDVISFIHCLEHVGNPREDLERAFALLRPGGILYIAVPNAGSLESNVFGSCWYALDLPRHFWGFNPRSLQRIIEESGFHLTGTHYQPLVNSLQSLRYAMRALSGRPLGDNDDPGAGVADKDGSLRTKLFIGQQRVSDMLGNVLQGEVMEFAAQKPA
jgi:SAM-dependent methyltransferase